MTLILVLALICFLVAAIGHMTSKAHWMAVGWLGAAFFALATLWPMIKLG